MLLDSYNKEELCQMYDDVTSFHEKDLFSLADEQSRYEGLQVYQKGGQKVIYKAFDAKTDRPIAIAKLHEGASESAVEFFLREARINAFLQHPNIIPVYDMGYSEGDYYFCMKFIEGETLDDILKKLEKSDASTLSKYPMPKLLDIYLRVCDAIHYAHSKGILHLDLKPSNIQIDEYGNVFVCDWGLSKISDDSELMEQEQEGIEKLSFLESDAQNLTVLGYAKGSPGFMAPEQTGQTKYEKSEKTDIYALGAILYTLLTYKKPIDGSLEDVIQKTRLGEVTPLSEHLPKAPVALEAMITKAMKVDPIERYQSVTELIDDLYAYRNHYATSAEDIGVLRLLILAFKRNQALFLSMLVSLFVLSGITVYYIQALKSKEERALEAKALAEKNLALYKEEKSMREILSEVGVDFFLSLAREKLNYHQYLGVGELLDLLPRESFNAEQIKELNSISGRVAFICQKFNKASFLLQQANEEDQFLITLSDKFKSKKSSDDEILNYRDVIQLMRDIRTEQTAMVRDIFNFYKKNYNHISDLIPVVKEFVIQSNNNIDDFNIKLIEKNGKYYLDVSNNPDLTYLPAFPDMKVLSGIDFSNSGTNRMHISSFTKLPLEELNVSGCGIKDYSFLRRCKSLKRITVNKKESESESFKMHSRGLEVIISD